MARLPRYNLPGQPQHVILRGNNRNIIFVAQRIGKELGAKNWKELGSDSI